ncbi:Mce-associated membrane protein [Mycobacterium sp. smrl_JER01]
MTSDESRKPVEGADLADDDRELLAELAEAEAAEAEARAAAARARAAAIRLRQHADEPVVADVAEGEQPNGSPSRRWRWPHRSTVAGVVAVGCTAALLAASGYMTWQHRAMMQTEQASAEFSAAARQVVVTLLSIDFGDAQADVQRILDVSTGEFREDFEAAADDFVKVAQDAAVTTEAQVTAAAVESMTPDSAVVLVTAATTVTNAAGAKDDPRSWRLSVNVARDGDQIKMSKVEFVP